MALKIDVKIPNTEESVRNAYAKIVAISGSKDQLGLCLFYYTKQPTPENQTIRFNSENFTFTPELDGKNFIAQGYEYLKTLPQFANAQDC